MLEYIVGFTTLLLVIGYYGIVRSHNFWRHRGIECEKPQFLVGHWGPVIFVNCCVSIMLKRFYDANPGKRCIALYQFLTPVLILKDPELIKQITVKDFDSFPTRTNYTSKNDDPVGSKNLFFLGDTKEWRDIRTTLNPSFTRNKLVIMFNLLVSCAEQLVHHFEEGKTSTFEANEIFNKVTNDIIATTAYGIECNTLKNPENELYLMGKNLLFGSIFNQLKFLIFYITPYLTKIFKIHLLNERTTIFFRNIVRQTINFRENSGVIRPDMLQLMIDARNRKLKAKNNVDPEDNSIVLTDDLIAAQCMIFYVGGASTLSATLSFLAYELALNPDVQNKLYDEILNTFQNCDGKITYEALLDMKYLDMVVSEGLRKWPSISLLDRQPKKAFKLTLEGGKELMVDEKVLCYIPVYALHRDPIYWPNPENFDPERFNDVNKRNIIPYSYLPFGAGPRNCIAQRFALLAEKIVVVHLLQNFEIITIEKTAIPLSVCQEYQDGICTHENWLGLLPRKQF